MPKATTARTTRSDRMPYRKSRSRRLDIGRSGLLLVIPSRSSLGRGEHAPERPDELGEFERQDEFRGGACPPPPAGGPTPEQKGVFVPPPPRPAKRREGACAGPPAPERRVSPPLPTPDT